MSRVEARTRSRATAPPPPTPQRPFGHPSGPLEVRSSCGRTRLPGARRTTPPLLPPPPPSSPAPPAPLACPPLRPISRPPLPLLPQSPLCTLDAATSLPFPHPVLSPFRRVPRLCPSPRASPTRSSLPPPSPPPPTLRPPVLVARARLCPAPRRYPERHGPNRSPRSLPNRLRRRRRGSGRRLAGRARSPAAGRVDRPRDRHHLADSEATAYIRLRRLIAEDEPTIIGYDEEEFARRLHYDRPIEPSLAVLAGVRAASLQLLESLTDAEWQRTGTHSESGPTRWTTGCGSTPVTRTTTPTRSAAPAAERDRASGRVPGAG